MKNTKKLGEQLAVKSEQNTICPASSDLFFIVAYVYKKGHYFLDTKYLLSKWLKSNIEIFGVGWYRQSDNPAVIIKFLKQQYILYVQGVLTEFI